MGFGFCEIFAECAITFAGFASVHALLQGSSVFAALLMLLNLIGWPWPPGPLLYAAALLLTLNAGLLALLHSFRLPLAEHLAALAPTQRETE